MTQPIDLIEQSAVSVLVSIESPLRGRVPSWVRSRWLAALFERFDRWRNMRYALACVRDSLSRGEFPYASHVFFDRRGLLDDADPNQRCSGMTAGLAWSTQATVFAFYIDRGFSSGMSAAHLAAVKAGARIEVRRLRGRRKMRDNNALDLKEIQNGHPKPDSPEPD
jgi:hypothetical protein